MKQKRESIKKCLERMPSWKETEEVIEKISEKGFRVLISGGMVRDALLGKTPKDLDLASSAPPEEILKLFPQAQGNFKKYGVVFLGLKGGGSLEITSFRTDSSYKDGRHPSSISYSSPEEDARRRDFTVNALFYDSRTEELMDFVGGEQDLKNKVLKTVGEAGKRFEEDHLRLLRALRLAHQLQFQIEEKTGEAIRLLAKKIQKISKERVQEELTKMLSLGRPDKALRALKNYHLFDLLFPELKEMESEPKNPFDFWSKDFSFLSSISYAWTVFSLPFFLKKPEELKLFFKKRAFSLKNQKQILSYLQAVSQVTDKKSRLTVKLLSLNGQKEEVKELTSFWLESLGKNSEILERTLKEFEKREEGGRLPAALLRGQDLLEAEVPVAKENFSRLLKEAFEYQMEHPEAGKTEILKHILKT